MDCWKICRRIKKPKKRKIGKERSKRRSVKSKSSIKESTTDSTQQTSTITSLETDFGEAQTLLSLKRTIPLKKERAHSLSSDFTWEAIDEGAEEHIGTQSINIPSKWSDSDEEEEGGGEMEPKRDRLALTRENEGPAPLVLTILNSDSWNDITGNINSGDTSTLTSAGKKLTETTTSKETSTELTPFGKE